MAATRCSEVGDARGLLSNHACVVFIQRTGAIPFDKDVRIRPNRQSRAAIAASFVAHDIAPLRAVYKSMSVRKWRHGSAPPFAYKPQSHPSMGDRVQGHHIAKHICRRSGLILIKPLAW